MSFLGSYLVACALLTVAGTAKAFRPHSTARALGALGGKRFHRPWVSMAVRVGALAEASLGVVGALAPIRIPAALISGSYLAFAGFVLYARHKGAALASCGCFSASDTPPTLLHVLLDLVFAASAAGVAVSGSRSLLASSLAHQPLHGVPFLLACGTGAWLSYLAIVALPRLGLLRVIEASRWKDTTELRDAT